jgi:hypothetical protein
MILQNLAIAYIIRDIGVNSITKEMAYSSCSIGVNMREPLTDYKQFSFKCNLKKT